MSSTVNCKCMTTINQWNMHFHRISTAATLVLCVSLSHWINEHHEWPWVKCARFEYICVYVRDLAQKTHLYRQNNYDVWCMSQAQNHHFSIRMHLKWVSRDYKRITAECVCVYIRIYICINLGWLVNVSQEKSESKRRVLAYKCHMIWSFHELF